MYNNIGNGELIYPIGLLTIDEAAYAGGKQGNYNSLYYLYTGQTYWTMTPYSSYTSSSSSVFIVYSNGGGGNEAVNKTNGVRPVINLRNDVPITGSGTTTDPFRVVGAS